MHQVQLDGHEVKAVHNGRDALSAFDGMQPDVALLDIGMPELKGYEVAREVRRHPRGHAVVPR